MHLHRLRRLLTIQTDQLFEKHGVLLPSSCVSIMLYLYEHQHASITELSEQLDYSHQLINQRLGILLSIDLVAKNADPRDRRRSRITLTRRGKNQARKLLELMPVTADAFATLIGETGTDLVEILTQTRKSLERRPLVSRVKESGQRVAQNL